MHLPTAVRSNIWKLIVSIGIGQLLRSRYRITDSKEFIHFKMKWPDEFIDFKEDF